MNTWEDSWIPQSPTKKVLTIRGSNLISRVCDLIDPVTGDWDIHFVNQTFWNVDVRRILAIPIPLYEMSDFIAWSPTKNSIFSVRPAYQIEWNFQFGDLTQVNAGPSSPDEKWNLIWSLECPAKIKIFIWRVLHAALPCRVVLASTHMKGKIQCPECRWEPDSIRRFLFECPRSVEVWRQLGLYERVKKNCTKYKSGEEVMHELLHVEDTEFYILGLPKMREMVATAAWYLWFEHHKVYHGEEIQTSTRIPSCTRTRGKFQYRMFTKR